jgi:hypothetical protein
MDLPLMESPQFKLRLVIKYFDSWFGSDLFDSVQSGKDTSAGSPIPFEGNIQVTL